MSSDATLLASLINSQTAVAFDVNSLPCPLNKSASNMTDFKKLSLLRDRQSDHSMITQNVPYYICLQVLIKYTEKFLNYFRLTFDDLKRIWG